MRINSSKIIQINNLSVCYGFQGKLILRDLKLDIKRGEHLAVIGPSGCGKSTFAKSLVQMLPKSAICDGDIFIDGKNLKTLNKEQLQLFRREKFGYIYQDSLKRLNPLMTVGAHLSELFKIHQPNQSNSLIRENVNEMFLKVGIDSKRINSYPHEFSGGMRQRVCIAMALALRPSIIIADEPTTSLDTFNSYQIMNQLLSLCRNFNSTLILISHDINLAAQWCKKVVIFSDGNIEEYGQIKEVLNSPKSKIGQKLVQSANSLKLKNFLKKDNQLILEVDNLRCWFRLNSSVFNPKWHKAINNVSFQLFRNETLGFVGMSGSGKTTLGRTLVGLLDKRGGSIKFNINQEKIPINLKIQKAKNIQMIFQDPFSSLNPKMTIRNILEDILLIHDFSDKALIQRKVKSILKKLDLPIDDIFLASYPNELSGGQLQRVAIARALLIKPEILICDESFTMLDASVKIEILKLLRRIQKEMNLSIIFITHDLLLAKKFCNRLLIINDGIIIEEGDSINIFNNPKHPITRKLIDSCLNIN
tara:strand:- start:1018 stop:2613 length:1596 start_codon:yes stop_codon:yes gene_type:complete